VKEVKRSGSGFGLAGARTTGGRVTERKEGTCDERVNDA